MPVSRTDISCSTLNQNLSLKISTFFENWRSNGSFQKPDKLDKRNKKSAKTVCTKGNYEFVVVSNLSECRWSCKDYDAEGYYP